MQPTVSVKKTDHAEKLAESLKALRRKDVLVGIPQDKSSRKGEGINNAELLYIHTHGSKLKHIPARPVIEPAIAHDRKPIAALLGAAAKDVIDGRPVQATAHLRAAGMRGMAAAIGWFTNPLNGWPPDKPATVRAKLRKLTGKRRKDALAALKAGDPGVNTPLIDTGQLRKSITYVLRDK